MKTGFDHAELARSVFAATGPAGTPDWFALRARFLAAHALQRVLAADRFAHSPGGGFMADGARVLASLNRDDSLVNPNVSGNGKPPSGNTAEVVVTPKTGDRGKL